MAEITLQQATAFKSKAVDLARKLGLEEAVRDIVRYAPQVCSLTSRTFEDGVTLVLQAFERGTHEARIALTRYEGTVTVYRSQDQGRDVQVFRPGRWIEHLLAWAEEVEAELERRRIMREASEADEIAMAFDPLDDWQPPASTVDPDPFVSQDPF